MTVKLVGTYKINKSSKYHHVQHSEVTKRARELTIMFMYNVIVLRLIDYMSPAKLTLTLFFIAVCRHYIDRVLDPSLIEEFFKFFRKNYFVLSVER